MRSELKFSSCRNLRAYALQVPKPRDGPMGWQGTKEPDVIVWGTLRRSPAMPE